jgi:mono/diheme cytochrome c family protein
MDGVCGARRRGRDLTRGYWSGSGWLVLGLLVVFTCGAARGEDIDQGKSAQQLFASSCAACHKSARGLTKRGYLSLYMFLGDHYVTNSSSAWALTSYLESVDDAPRGRPQGATKKPAKPPQVNQTAGSPPRPPAAVPPR